MMVPYILMHINRNTKKKLEMILPQKVIQTMEMGDIWWHKDMQIGIFLLWLVESIKMILNTLSHSYL